MSIVLFLSWKPHSDSGRKSFAVDFISLFSNILDSTFPAMDNSEIPHQFVQSALSLFLLKTGIMSAASFRSFYILTLCTY